MKPLVLFIALILGVATPLAAQERSALWPDVPTATGTPHPEGNEYWRRNHMELMRHDRDLTLRQGTRDIGASLNGCFDCHTTKDASGIVLTYQSEKHFCRACHDFVAVKVDCFMCHRSTPAGVDEDAAHAAIRPAQSAQADPAAILAYLNQLSPEPSQASQ